MKIGLLAAGHDVPGTNAAIRAIGKAAIQTYNMNVMGFLDGFEGLLADTSMPIQSDDLSNILTTGGTFLGTSRHKPLSAIEDEMADIRSGKAAEVYRRHNLDCLVIIGGHFAIRTANELVDQGLHILALPKAIDNHVPGSDRSIGFHTATEIATEAIDRLHGTAFTHHNVIIVEILGLDAGWLALSAGLSGGADVILIPEIPYKVEKIAETIAERNAAGKRFTIIALSEGARSQESISFFNQVSQANERLREGEERLRYADHLRSLRERANGDSLLLANRIEELTNLSCRITILGYLLRGGVPSAGDRVLATQLGAVCADHAAQGIFGKLVGSQGDRPCVTPLAEVAGKIQTVPADHVWIHAGRLAGISFGD